jgi:hypothetical protein
MKPPTPSTEQIRQSLVEQIAAITTMQPGTLAEEYREHPDADGKGVVRRGPYFKHQCWHDGRNLSRRVPVTQAAQLRQDIDNAKLFGQLTAQLAQLNIQHTLALRTAEAATAGAVLDAQKNSTPKRARKGSVKPRPSSPKPRRA